MILSELRDYMRTHRRVPLIDMANHFDIDPDALRLPLTGFGQKRTPKPGAANLSFPTNPACAMLFLETTANGRNVSAYFGERRFCLVLLA